MLLGLQKTIVYGPVHSRRLGRSLGLNIMPRDTKLCTFDCLYCQYGWTGVHAADSPDGIGLPAVREVLDALETALARLDSPPAYITFSGNGEATLHPDFPAIVEGVVALRDRRSPQSKTAILSNSTTVTSSVIRAALERLDVRIMKLDSGSEEMFRAYNRPCGGIRFESVVAGLASLRDVTIQALFTGGAMGNNAPDAVEHWCDAVERVHPVMVQVYTLDRGYPSRQIEPLTRAELLAITARLESRSIRAEVY